MNARLAPPASAGGAPLTSERDARLAALAARRPAGVRPTTVGPEAGFPLQGGRARRRHAAKGSRAASLGLSIASTGALAAFFAVSDAGSGTQVQAAAIVTGSAAAGNGAAASGPAASSVASATTAPAAVPTVVDITIAPPVTQPADAAPVTTPAPTTTAVAVPATETIVHGGVFQNKWGDVQVQATFAADGSLVDVVTLQAPDRDGKSVRINDRATPLLDSEALSVQSADVDTVSGATYTSDDYRRSLQSAIDVARDAGITTIA